MCHGVACDAFLRDDEGINLNRDLPGVVVDTAHFLVDRGVSLLVVEVCRHKTGGQQYQAGNGKRESADKGKAKNLQTHSSDRAPDGLQLQGFENKASQSRCVKLAFPAGRLGVVPCSAGVFF
jgi:hypothetical protein